MHRSFFSSPVVRRPTVLIYSLRRRTFGNLPSVGIVAMEADATRILKAIIPPLDPAKYKGQAGKIAVVGGCREYTGAPYFAAISALKIGADLSHVFCTRDAAPVIKSYSPELIVHPVLEESYNIGNSYAGEVSAKVVAEVEKWLGRFDCLVVGPGLGRDPFLMECVSEIINSAKKARIPIVVDGDGLFLVTNNMELIGDYPLAVLTPNVNEYKRLIQKVMGHESSEENALEEALQLSNQIGGATILRKGKSDIITDGKVVQTVTSYGSPRRCGGQGDVLSGSVAVLISWARNHTASSGGTNIREGNPTVMGCIAASALVRKAAFLAFENRRRSTLCGDIIDCLGMSLEEMCPSS